MNAEAASVSLKVFLRFGWKNGEAWPHFRHTCFIHALIQHVRTAFLNEPAATGR